MYNDVKGAVPEPGTSVPIGSHVNEVIEHVPVQIITCVIIARVLTVFSA